MTFIDIASGKQLTIRSYDCFFDWLFYRIKDNQKFISISVLKELHTKISMSIMLDDIDADFEFYPNPIENQIQQLKYFEAKLSEFLKSSKMRKYRVSRTYR